MDDKIISSRTPTIPRYPLSAVLKVVIKDPPILLSIHPALSRSEFYLSILNKVPQSGLIFYNCPVFSHCLISGSQLNPLFSHLCFIKWLIMLSLAFSDRDNAFGENSYCYKYIPWSPDTYISFLKNISRQYLSIHDRLALLLVMQQKRDMVLELFQILKKN